MSTCTLIVVTDKPSQLVRCLNGCFITYLLLLWHLMLLFLSHRALSLQQSTSLTVERSMFSVCLWREFSFILKTWSVLTTTHTTGRIKLNVLVQECRACRSTGTSQNQPVAAHTLWYPSPTINSLHCLSVPALHPFAFSHMFSSRTFIK